MNEITITDVRVLPGDSGFLVDDGETAILCDSGFGFTGKRLAENIQKHLGDRPLACIFLTHSHYDHALGSAHVLRAYPEAKVVAGKHAAEVFLRPGAKATMRRLDRQHADRCGITEYEDLADVLRVDMAVQDGDIIHAGGMTFTAVGLPGHTRCSLGFWCKEAGLLLGTETLGVYNSESDVVPSYLVGYGVTLDSIDRAAALRPDAILVPHYGVLRGEQAVFYLRKGRQQAIATAEAVFAALRNGVDKQRICEEFMAGIQNGFMQSIYPTDAMALNTHLMVDLLEREMKERKEET